jgi:hypothetical protein
MKTLQEFKEAYISTHNEIIESKEKDMNAQAFHSYFLYTQLAELIERKTVSIKEIQEGTNKVPFKDITFLNSGAYICNKNI